MSSSSSSSSSSAANAITLIKKSLVTAYMKQTEIEQYMVKTNVC